MFTLNFKKQFAQAVEAGEKRQTIRALRKDGRRPQIGDDLRLYTGMRTTACRRLLDATCTEVSPIQIYYEKFMGYSIVVGGKKLTPTEGVDLAMADGFGTRAEFIGFFLNEHSLPFDGLMIRWDPKVNAAGQVDRRVGPQRLGKGKR